MHVIDVITFIVCAILIISLFGCTVYKISEVAVNNQQINNYSMNNYPVNNQPAVIQQQKNSYISTQETIKTPNTILKPVDLYDLPMCASEDIDILINEYIKSATIVSF